MKNYRRYSRNWLLALLLLPILRPGFAADNGLSRGPQLKYQYPDSLSGTIYAKDSDSKTALYKFTRQATRSGTKLNVFREFTYPDGRPAARQRLVYEGDELVSLQLEELQIAAAGSATIRADPNQPAKRRLVFAYSKNISSRGKPKSAEQPLQADTLTDDMMGPFLSAHWDALVKGESVRCRYISIPRCDTFGFTFTKSFETTWHDQPAVVVKMAASSFIIASSVGPLFFTLEKKGRHRVLQYVGQTTPKLKIGNKWTDLDAVTVFDWK